MTGDETKEEESEAKLSKEAIKDLAEMFGHLLGAYASFAITLGKTQKNYEEAYKTMFSLELAEKLPEMLSQLSEAGPPELSKLLTRLFVKMATILPRIGKLMDLSAGDKIKLGKNLKSLAEDFNELLVWFEKVKEE